MKLKFEKKTKLEDYLNSIEPRFYPLLAFILTALVYGIILSGMGLMGNGLYVLETGDLKIQIIPFIMRFCDVIRGKHDYWYSWDIALGSGAAGTYAYYTLSPFNIFYLILGMRGVHAATYIITVLKAAAAALTFQLFIAELNKKSYYETVIFSISYALCGYMVCYYHAFLNMDAVLIFPMIMTGILRAFRYKRFTVLLMSYTYLIGVQVYMGYVAGVSSFIIFLVYYLYKRVELQKKERVIILSGYAICTLTALCLTAFIWLPALFNIFELNYSYDLYKEIPNCNILILLNNLFLGQYQSIDGFVPYIYCGILTVISLPMYFLNSKIKRKERIYMGIGMGLFILFMLISPLNIALHGFDSPNKVGYRYSFVLSFILLVILSRQFIFMRGKHSLKFKYMFIILLGCCVIFSLSKFFYLKYWGEKYDSNTIWLLPLDMVFIVLWFLVLRLYDNKRFDILTKRVFITSLLIIEIAVNIVISYKRVNAMDSVFNYDYYTNAQNNTVKRIKADMKDDICVRTIYEDSYIDNVAILNDLNSLSVFSSIINNGFISGINKLGFAKDVNAIKGNGWTPVTLSLLRIGYIVDGANIISDDPDVPVLLEANEHYYQNYAKFYDLLPLAFSVNKDILDYRFSDDVFDNQDRLLSAMTGENVNCYTDTDMYIKSDDVTVKQEEDGVKIYNNNYPDDEAVAVFMSREKSEAPMFANLYNENKIYDGMKGVPLMSAVYGYLNNTNIPTLTPSQIIEVGHDENNVGMFTMTISRELEYVEYKKGNFVYYDPDKFKDVYDKLSRKGMVIEEFKDGYIRGKITNNEPNVLFTSIPYEKGWKIYVDGKENRVIPLLEKTFLGTELESGEHEVVFEFDAIGRKPGKIISLAALIFVLLYSFVIKKKVRF